MRRWLPALALIFLLGGCASAGAPPSGTPDPGPSADPTESAGPRATPVPVPRFVSAADDGAIFSMTVDQTTTLRAEASAPDPLLEGDAVLLIESVNVAAGDGREWEVRAVAPGTATVSGEDWEITFDVSE